MIREMAQMETEEKKIFDLFYNYFGYTLDEDLYKIIDFYYYFRTYVIELENQGEKITFENEFLIHQLADYLVVENEVNDLLDYYKEEIRKL